MSSFHFGSRNRQLFGTFMPAVGRRQRRAVVLCPPLLHEYIYAHRAMRMLAERLAATGLDVLRFDYYGTGDSAGDGEELTLAGCVSDAAAAVEEAADLAGARRVTLVGLRLGALIAARACAVRAVDRVVLWDPVHDGASHIDSLFATAARTTSSAGVTYARGFPVPAALVQELRQVDVDRWPAPARNVMLVVSAENPRHYALIARLRTRSDADVAYLPGVPAWREDGDLGAGAVPVDILDHIAAWGTP